MRQLFLLFFFFFCISEALPNWQRPVINFNRQAYRAANQNWMVEQHENGWMYFANNKGLLEYDGTSWNTYSIHNAKTRAVKCSSDGRIYVGGLRQFGYFIPNSLGGLDYVCLSDSLGNEKPGNIWNIQIAEGRVYFQADRHISYLENDSIKQINYGMGIMYSAIVNNKFYIATWEGLYILNGDILTLLPHTKEAAKSKIVGLYPMGSNILIVTSRHGMFLYDGAKVTAYDSAANSFLQSNQLLCTARKDSLIALGSMHDGVLLLNTSSNAVEKISIHNGLQNKTILSMTFDKENNLWLGLDNGIDCINLTSPMYFLYSNNSAIGSGYASAYYQGKLYLGTNQGLYITDYPISLAKETKPNLISGTEGQVWSLMEYDNKLFCGGSNALIVVDKERVTKVDSIRGVWSIKKTAYPDMLLAGTYTGLYLLKKNGAGWQVSHRLEGSEYSPKVMFTEKMSNTVWVANKEHGLHRLTLSADLKSVTDKNYNSKELPAGNNVYISSVDDEIVIASRQGLFRYNQIKDCLERYEALEKLLDGNTVYTYISQDEQGDIWYVANGMLKLVRYDPQNKKYDKDESETYLKNFLIEDFEHIQTFGNDQALIGTEEGFSLLEFDENPPEKFPLNLQIRKVFLTIGKDSLIYGRSYAYNDAPLVIPYQHNSMRIAYSANNYNKTLVTLYSYKLEGDENNNDWSEYSTNTTKEYTNLEEGKYTFSVKIITSQNRNPVMTSFSFEVLPPWYRTWWAYVAYTFSMIAFLFYAYCKLNKKQKKTIWQKEQEIVRQKRQNELKDRKIDSLKEEKLKAELTHKSNELMHTTLNVVRKNEMLQEIKKEVVGISHSIDEKNLPNIRRKILRLVSHIDTNIEHDDDLHSFETSFDSIHHHFFEKLDEQFPGLNKKEKLMCAYIRMNLMSKEIAPLINISVRGVEISRYRLRKKLHLNQEENLADFLQNL